MKKNLKISRRYAKALMLLAREENKVDAFRKSLSSVTELLCGSELEAALLNPVYLATQRRGLLTAVLDKLQIEDTLYRFVVFVFDKERLDEIAAIDEAFQAMADHDAGLVRAHVKSAVAVPDAVTREISEAVMKYTGREVVFDLSEDPDLIGGLIVRLGDYVYDGSVRTQVANMRDLLKRGDSAN